MWCRGSVVAGLATGFLAIASTSAPAQKDLASCKAVFDGAMKQITTPNHSYMTMTTGAQKPTTSESINTGSVRYIQIQGKWKRSPMTPKDELARTQENIRNATVYQCRKLRSESLSGVATTVYSVHAVTEGGTSDGQVWIANGTGLPVREDIELGETGSRVVSRFDYASVRAPAGVK